MRLKFANKMFAKKSKKIAIVVAVLAVLCAASASAQNPDTLTPEASAAKAHQILQQLIDAYGGPTYMDILTPTAPITRKKASSSIFMWATRAGPSTKEAYRS